MLIRVSGGSSGITSYLINGQKSGREYNRDELDQRVLLSGSITGLDAVLDSFDTELNHQKYMHITMSFKEALISEDMLRDIDIEFRDFIKTACHEDEFYYYSEAHLPKLKHLPDKFGAEYERFPHIHVVIPEYNLCTAKRENPLGRISSITHYIDAFQEHINNKYGLESPKDNVRELSVGRESIINRYELKPDMSRKQVKEKLFDLVRSHPEISSVEELAVAIKPLGQVKIRDSKKFGAKYINFTFDDAGKRKAINLKDAVFLDDYLSNRDKAVTQSHTQDKYNQLVDDWKQFGALEVRFVGKSAKQVREAYYAMDAEGKEKWLVERWNQHIETISSIIGDRNTEKRIIEPKNCLIYRESIHIDEIPHVENENHIDDIKHIDDFRHLDDIPTADMENIHETKPTNRSKAPTSELDLSALRERSSARSRGEGGLASETDLLSSNQRDDMDGDQAITYTNVYVVRAKGELGAVDQFSGSITKRYEEMSWTQRINAIDGRTLLDYLSYQYKLDTKSVTIERNKNGIDRIVADGRRYSAADYLTKKMNLTWPESKVILTTVLERQKDGGYAQQAITSRLMWARFQRYEENLPGLSAVYKKYREEKEKIKTKYRYSYSNDLTKAQNIAQRKLMTQQRIAELTAARNEWLREQQYYRQSPNDRYLQWLHSEAEQGSNAALGELYRVYPQYDKDEEIKSIFTIEIKEQSSQHPFAPLDLGYAVKIRRNGTVEYLDKNEKTVISDTYQSIKVHDRKAETIAKALELARARFGVNGFEIRNASQADLKAVMKAVNMTKTEVSIKSVNKVESK